MTTNLFIIANIKQLLTSGSFRILLSFFRTFWGVGVQNSSIFNIFHNRVEFGTILEGLRNFGGSLNPQTPPRYTTDLWLGIRGVESGKYLSKMIRFCQDDDDGDDDD